MRVRLRGYELRRRSSLDDQHVAVPARALNQLLRAVVAEVPAHQLRALLAQSNLRGAGLRDAPLEAALRRQIEAGELVVVSRAEIRVGARPQPEPEAPVYEPAAPEDIVENNDWIEILVEDEDEQPVSGVAYELELPDGSVRRGRTNQFGIARWERIPSGSCKLSLVELDTVSWSYPA
ncbi:hypothetical protein DB30_06286 [Enhygromyxa salina]|uniref:Uncharacterized protein n=1 Tax=Enhygromyxa salina TaxID=215803 RepID=A0A0C1ZUU6_9BACT|nr:hypothetical protein [Enhygromyxa salina]KIG14833.1 hypothetical protein DB30_06286 [Enhygromyxa salina]